MAPGPPGRRRWRWRPSAETVAVTGESPRSAGKRAAGVAAASPGSPTFRLGGDLAVWRGPRRSREGYAPITENPFRRVAADPLSTFSVDVDTASYANMRRFLTNGDLPPLDAVRIEELINYFRFDYREAPAGAAILGHDRAGGVPVESGPPPGADRPAGPRVADCGDAPPRNLVFLLDVSGSMQPQDKLPLVQASMRMLVDTLRRAGPRRDRRLRRRQRPGAAVDTG